MSSATQSPASSKTSPSPCGYSQHCSSASISLSKDCLRYDYGGLFRSPFFLSPFLPAYGVLGATVGPPSSTLMGTRSNYPVKLPLVPVFRGVPEAQIPEKCLWYPRNYWHQAQKTQESDSGLLAIYISFSVYSFYLC